MRYIVHTYGVRGGSGLRPVAGVIGGNEQVQVQVREPIAPVLMYVLGCQLPLETSRSHK